jgi:hypothetical protein
MEFPKPLMSIAQLSELGFSKSMLKEYARAKDSPIIKTAGGGKIFFITDKLIEYIEKKQKDRK